MELLLATFLALAQTLGSPPQSVSTPEARQVVIPRYLESILLVPESGEVKVDLRIKKDGTVSSAKVLSGPLRLSAIAEEAALGWKFQRATVAERKLQITFAFILRPGIGVHPMVEGVFMPPARVEVYAEPRQIETFPNAAGVKNNE